LALALTEPPQPASSSEIALKSTNPGRAALEEKLEQAITPRSFHFSGTLGKFPREVETKSVQNPD
jgi:hypothetical protein